MEQMFRSFLDQFQNIQGTARHPANDSPACANGPDAHDETAVHGTPSSFAAVGGELTAQTDCPNPNANKIQQLLDAAEADAAEVTVIAQTNTSIADNDGPVDQTLATDADDEIPIADSDSATHVDGCYADGFGELDADTYGQLRYVGLGSTASVVDHCVGLRRHIHQILEEKGFEPEEPFFASPDATHFEGPAASPICLMSSNDLPPPILAEALIDIYVNEQAFLFPIIPERDIRQIHSVLVAQSERDPGYAAIFFALLAVSASLLPPNHSALEGLDQKWRSEHLGASFYNEAMQYVNMPFRGKSERKGRSQDIVVALGLLSMYLAQTGSQAEAWISVGRAIRNAQDLGLHRSPERLRLPMEERNKRRYIWWCLYILERQLCTALGRPLCIDDQDCDTEVPSPLSDDAQGNDLAGFTGMIHLHRIIGQILKLVNSVRNADAWRNEGKIDELRARVREANESLQTWAKDMVPSQIKTAKTGKLLAEKHVALSSFFSAVMLLHRVFMSNPHRSSPLAESQAQLKSAKAATDCIRETHEFFRSVPRSHYVIFHGQYIFVSAIVLLQCIRRSEEPQFVYSALRDVDQAMQELRNLEGFWKGARRCRVTVEEYLDFTLFYVLQGHRNGNCPFNCDHDTRPTSRSTLKKRLASVSRLGGRDSKRMRLTGPELPTPETVASLSSSNSREKDKARGTTLQSSNTPFSVVGIETGFESPRVQQVFHDPQQLEDTYFDDTIGNFLGAISPSFHIPNPYVGDLSDIDFSTTGVGLFATDASGLQNSFF